MKKEKEIRGINLFTVFVVEIICTLNNNAAGNTTIFSCGHQSVNFQNKGGNCDISIIIVNLYTYTIIIIINFHQQFVTKTIKES